MNLWNFNISKAKDNNKRDKIQFKSLSSVLLFCTTASVSCAEFSDLKRKHFSDSLTVYWNQIASLCHSQLPTFLEIFWFLMKIAAKNKAETEN